MTFYTGDDICESNKIEGDEEISECFIKKLYFYSLIGNDNKRKYFSYKGLLNIFKLPVKTQEEEKYPLKCNIYRVNNIKCGVVKDADENIVKRCRDKYKMDILLVKRNLEVFCLNKNLEIENKYIYKVRPSFISMKKMKNGYKYKFNDKRYINQEYGYGSYGFVFTCLMKSKIKK